MPERLLPIACLALAALLAFGVARARPWLVPLVLVLVAVDLHVGVFHPRPADEGNQAYAALRAQPPGRLLELPVFLPDIHYGSVYQYYDLQARRERPAGYSTVAPLASDALMRKLRPLNCGQGGYELLPALDLRLRFHCAVARAGSTSASGNPRARAISSAGPRRTPRARVQADRVRRSRRTLRTILKSWHLQRSL